jgi:uncharacterized sulfatase
MEDVKGLYDGCVRMADRFIGKVLDEIDLDDTVVILTADHGEELYEHGNRGHRGFYDEALEVPLVIHGPSGSSSRHGFRSQLADIGPTVLGYAGVESLESFRGDDLNEVEDDRPVIAQTATNATGQLQDDSSSFQACLIEDGYKYVYAPDGENMLFEEHGSDEKENLVDEMPGVAEKMNERLRELGGVPEGGEAEPEVPNEKVKEKLADMGYMSE